MPQDQEVITEIIYEKCEEIPARAEALENEYMDKMTSEYNIEIVHFSDEELNAFAESCRKNVWPQLAENLPADFLDNILADIEGG